MYISLIIFHGDKKVIPKSGHLKLNFVTEKDMVVSDHVT